MTVHDGVTDSGNSQKAAPSARYLSLVKQARGVVRLVTTTGVAFLAAAGLGLALRAQTGEASFTKFTSPQGTAPAPTAQMPTRAVVGPTVTLTARPTPAPPSASRSLQSVQQVPQFTAQPTISQPPNPAATPDAPPTLDFELSSFNVLGSSHTASSGKRPGMAPGPVRARWAADLIRRHGADVVGFQELQANQLATLQQQTGLDFFPGSSMRRADTENSIGWRRDMWVALETHTVDIPYFNGNRRAMPYVKLRNLSTGIDAWFANFHNPADTSRFHQQKAYRSRATEIEIALVNRLLREGDAPVFVTGDMNERDSYFCQLTGEAPMVAARGGTNYGQCRPDNPRAVDWIFGSQGVLFTGYVEDRSRLVGRTTDHPMLVARVHLVGAASDVSQAPGAVGSD